MGPKRKHLSDHSFNALMRWNEPSDYPKPDELDDDHWHWEFLRRRQDYREEWEKHCQVSYDYARLTMKDSLSQDHFLFKATLDYLIPRIQQQQIPLEEVQKIYQDFERFPLVGGLPNPSIRRPLPLDFSPACFPCPKVTTQSGKLIQSLPDHLVGKTLYAFDLRYPYAPQLQKAKSWFETLQKLSGKRKVGRRKQKLKWPQYLRVLDAREAGLTFYEIGNEVLNHPGTEAEKASAAKDIYESACNLGINFPN